MENQYNVLQNYAIKIAYRENSGSGVIFRICDKNIVLTAYHIIKEELSKDTELLIEKTINGVEKQIDIKVVDFAFDKDNDLAVLVIDSREPIFELKLFKPNIDQTINMYGYPYILQKSKDIHSYALEGKVKNVDQNKIYIKINEKLGSTETEEKAMLDGFSGSGFYLKSGKTVKLCGIETNVLTKDVAYNAVCGVNVDTIISILGKTGLDVNSLLNESVSTAVKQSNLYMRYLVPIDDLVKRNVPLERLQNEYREGIAAQPEHIRKCLDVRRDIWINQIEEKFEVASIVVIRGASGQGKTSLAYRYLLERYSEGQILSIQRLTSENSIWTILQFLKRELEDSEYVLYYDVQPGDLFWGQLLSAVSVHLPDTPLLVTVREEDYNSSNVSCGSIHYEEISLKLYKDEAKEIYAQYNQHSFLSFDSLWESFGDGGPLLEFIYLLNHSMTLEEKINSQIAHISYDVDEREWFNVLAIIAIAGQFDLSIRLDRLFERIELRNASKLLQQFEKEFFVKISDNGERVKCLHSVRARLIINSLEGKFGFDYFNSLQLTLSIIDSSTIYLFLEYIDKNGMSAENVDKLSQIPFNDLSVTEDVLRGLLWFAVMEYLRDNKDVIEEGNHLCVNNYVMIALCDITGFIDTKNTSYDLWKIFDKQTPGIADVFKAIVNKQPRRYLEYSYSKRFLENISGFIRDYVERNPVNGRSLGYILFWANKLDVSINIDSAITVTNPKDYIGISGLVKGLIYQGLLSKADEIKRTYEKDILCDANIVSLFSENDEIFAEVVPDYYSKSKKNRTLKSSNDKCMYAIDLLSSLYPQMKRYNVTLLGTRIAEIVVPDTEKHIMRENLPEKWITELNGICLKIQEYEHCSQDWKEVFYNINSYRNKITESLEEVLRQLGKFYRKGKFDNSKINKLFLELKEAKGFDIPKCARDKFGISNETKALKSKKQNENTFSDKIVESIDRSGHLWVGDACNKFFRGISNYLNGLNSMMDGMTTDKNPNEYCRMQLYYIVSSYEIYCAFCKANNVFFAAYGCEVDTDKEKMILEKTVALTHWIYLNGYHIENNIVYDTYELFKRKKRAIDTFLKQTIGEYPEVKGIDYSERNIIINANMVESGLLIEKIYCEVQRLVGHSGLISPARGYLFNKIDNFCIVLSDGIYEDFLTIDIPINSFTLAKDIEQLHKYIMGAETKYSIVPPEYLRHGAVSSVIFICDQLVQIEEGLLNNSKYSISESIDSINKALKLELIELTNKIKEFHEYEELYLDLVDICSLKLITIDEAECQRNFDILEDFISKYAEDL